MKAELITHIQIIINWMTEHWLITSLLWFFILFAIITFISIKNAPEMKDDKEI